LGARDTQMRITTAFLIVSFLLGCHRSGTWIDDPRNFERAWGTRPPSGVQLVRSWYWRSPHFTREEIYYFQLKAPQGYAEAFARENRLALVRPNAISRFSFEQHKPKWFAPKPAAAYAIWSAGTDDPACYVLLDKQSGELFIHALQL